MPEGFFSLLFVVKIERRHAPHDCGLAAQFSLQTTGKKPLEPRVMQNMLVRVSVVLYRAVDDLDKRCINL